MTGSEAYGPERMTGYQLERLAAAFDRVRNARDWKAPIFAVIPEAEQRLVEKAVRWFTDTVPVFAPAPGVADHLVVSAPGYRLGLAREADTGCLRGSTQQPDSCLEAEGRLAEAAA